MKFTESQKEFIKENYADEVDEVISLYYDLYEEYYNDNFDDIATKIYEEYLDEEQQKEIDEI